MNKHEYRKFVLGCYGLTAPKDLPEECKHCNNFYCALCIRCRRITKKNTDWDCYAPSDNETENYKDYKKHCDAIVREYLQEG